MSTTNLLCVSENGEILSYEEYRNSHGTTPCILDIIQNKLNLSNWNDIYKNIDKLNDNDKILLRFFNCDNVIFFKDTINLLINAIDEFNKKHKLYFKSRNRVYHIDKILDDILKIKNDTELLGVALNATSIGDCDIFEGVEENGNYRPFNIFKDRYYKFNIENYVTKWKSQK